MRGFEALVELDEACVMFFGRMARPHELASGVAYFFRLSRMFHEESDGSG